jgi:hypothetical protein
MPEGGVGRLLVASLHQGIADLLPTRLEFYEGWLNPSGLREGRIGLAQLAAALSFLRQEGPPYHLIAARAGEYTAEWTVAGLPPIQRSTLRALPPKWRARFAVRIARRMVRQTYGGSRAAASWTSGRAAIDIRGSLFCEVRSHVEEPLCEYYAASIRRLMQLASLGAEVSIEGCRATGARQCLVSVAIRDAEVTP